MKKNIIRKTISFIMILSLVFSFANLAQATQSKSGNFSTNYSLTGNGATDIVNVAQAQLDKTKSNLGYTEGWCADFVSDCAKLAGLSSIIPFNGGVSALKSAIINAGGTTVSSRQKGDIVFYYCKSCQDWKHVGIVLDGTYSIEGNVGGKVYKVGGSNGNYKDGSGHTVTSGTVTRTYVRPAYNNTSSFTLTYNANGGTGAPASQTGSTSYTISSTIPTRFGYNFLGWGESPNSTSTYDPGYTLSLSGNKTLYAIWYEAQDITNTIYIGGTIRYNEKEYYKFTPSVTAIYTFLTLNTTNNLDTQGTIYSSSGTSIAFDDDSGENRNFSVSYNLTHGNTYYLEVKGYSGSTGDYRLHIYDSLYYDANGGSGAPNVQTGQEAYTISSTVPSRTNYTFLGWSTNPNATSAEYNSGSTIYVFEPTTLYAVWRYNPPSTYTLTYNANGGTGAPSSQSGSTSYAISSTVPHRVGYTFLGWSTSSSDSSFTYIPGNTITLSSNTTLYASWQAARTVNTSSSNLANINFENQVRAYKFTPSSSGTYVFESSGSADSKIYLYNSSGTEIAKDDDSGNGNNFKLSYNLNAGSTYYLGVRLYSTETGEVSFTVKKESSSQGSTNKCPYCNNIFTDESEYNKHLANCDGYFNNNNNIRVTIRNNPGTRTLNYGDTVRIYADAQNLPAGAKIGWFANNQDLIITSVAPDGTYCEITADGTGTITLEAKAVDANGNIIKDSQGNWIGDSQKINVKTSLWLRIVSFFKNLFGMNRTTVQLFKEIF